VVALKSRFRTPAYFVLLFILQCCLYFRSPRRNVSDWHEKYLPYSHPPRLQMISTLSEPNIKFKCLLYINLRTATWVRSILGLAQGRYTNFCKDNWISDKAERKMCFSSEILACAAVGWWLMFTLFGVSRDCLQSLLLLSLAETTCWWSLSWIRIAAATHIFLDEYMNMK